MSDWRSPVILFLQKKTSYWYFAEIALFSVAYSEANGIRLVGVQNIAHCQVNPFVAVRPGNQTRITDAGHN
jgi:ribulose bisphosphate carboxylase small subunit